MRKLIIGNWKMNGSLAVNAALLAGIREGWQAGYACAVGVAVPAVYLAQVQALLQGTPIALAAQDVSPHEKGAYTGEVSAAMLQDFGVRYVLTGHSERRQYHGEVDESVAAKALAAVQAGLSPVVCVGETWQEREAGLTHEVVQRQLAAVLAHIGAEKLSALVVAYEPVWAIGTGKTATPEQAQAVHAVLRAQLLAVGGAGRDVPLLYGGSMNPTNAGQLLAQPDIDGGLIGGASLKAGEFLHIIAAAG